MPLGYCAPPLRAKLFGRCAPVPLCPSHHAPGTPRPSKDQYTCFMRSLLRICRLYILQWHRGTNGLQIGHGLGAAHVQSSELATKDLGHFRGASFCPMNQKRLVLWGCSAPQYSTRMGHVVFHRTCQRSAREDALHGTALAAPRDRPFAVLDRAVAALGQTACERAHGCHEPASPSLCVTAHLSETERRCPLSLPKANTVARLRLPVSMPSPVLNLRVILTALFWGTRGLCHGLPLGLYVTEEDSLDHGARDALEGKAAPEAVRQAAGGCCQSGWGRLLSVADAIEPGTCRHGNSG